MKATHKFAEDKYETLRDSARNLAATTLPRIMSNGKGQAISLRESVRLAGIDLHTRLKAKSWDDSPFRQVTWDWSDLVSDYVRLHPKRFELAVWYRDLFLCGLSIGRPTWSDNKLRLDFIEASPEETPLTGLITDITIAAAEAYADVIGVVQLRIMNPINDKVRAHYLAKGRGFTYDRRGNYCFKDLA
ncbi:hypothetical protein [Microbulbifer taiwanensis]